MPNRIIKESICTSENIAALSMGAEVLFYHLIVKADDYGVYFGNEQIIRSTCYPLKTDEIKLKQVESWLNELVSAGLVNAYIAEDGKKYIQFAKWSKHQQIRAKRSKYPVMDDSCSQLISDDCKCPRNPIQSNPNRRKAQMRLRVVFWLFGTCTLKKSISPLCRKKQRLRYTKLVLMLLPLLLKITRRKSNGKTELWSM